MLEAARRRRQSTRFSISVFKIISVSSTVAWILFVCWAIFTNEQRPIEQRLEPLEALVLLCSIAASFLNLCGIWIILGSADLLCDIHEVQMARVKRK